MKGIRGAVQGMSSQSGTAQKPGRLTEKPGSKPTPQPFDESEEVMAGREIPVRNDASQQFTPRPGPIGALRTARGYQKLLDKPAQTSRGNVAHLLRDTDQQSATMAALLSRQLGRGSNQRRTFAGGGKIRMASPSLQRLAEKFSDAVSRNDTDTARRAARMMEAEMEGATALTIKQMEFPTEKARQDKLATFAGGGKVKGALKPIQFKIGQRVVWLDDEGNPHQGTIRDEEKGSFHVVDDQSDDWDLGPEAFLSQKEISKIDWDAPFKDRDADLDTDLEE